MYCQKYVCVLITTLEVINKGWIEEKFQRIAIEDVNTDIYTREMMRKIVTTIEGLQCSERILEGGFRSVIENRLQEAQTPIPTLVRVKPQIKRERAYILLS